MKTIILAMLGLALLFGCVSPPSGPNGSGNSTTTQQNVSTNSSPTLVEIRYDAGNGFYGLYDGVIVYSNKTSLSFRGHDSYVDQNSGNSFSSFEVNDSVSTGVLSDGDWAQLQQWGEYNQTMALSNRYDCPEPACPMDVGGEQLVLIYSNGQNKTIGFYAPYEMPSSLRALLNKMRSLDN